MRCIYFDLSCTHLHPGELEGTEMRQSTPPISIHGDHPPAEQTPYVEARTGENRPIVVGRATSAAQRRGMPTGGDLGCPC
jgi:hypothetical protein